MAFQLKSAMGEREEGGKVSSLLIFFNHLLYLSIPMLTSFYLLTLYPLPLPHLAFAVSALLQNSCKHWQLRGGVGTPRTAIHWTADMAL